MILDFLFFNLYEDGPIYDFIYASLICYFVNYEFSYWLCVSYCVEIMFLLSIDRFICIVLPFKYRSLRRVYFYIALVLAFAACVILNILSSTITYVTHTITKNETTFTCNDKGLDLIIYVFLILFYSSQTLIFVILNTVTSVHLWKSIKNRFL